MDAAWTPQDADIPLCFLKEAFQEINKSRVPRLQEPQTKTLPEGNPDSVEATEKSAAARWSGEELKTPANRSGAGCRQPELYQL